MEHHVGLDSVLARHCTENGAALLRVEPEVVDEVPVDCVETRLVAAAAVDPISGTAHRHAVLADVPHLVGGDERMAVVVGQEYTIATNGVEKGVIDRAVLSTIEMNHAAFG